MNRGDARNNRARRWHAVVFAVLLAGCPSKETLETERTAECCGPEDGGDGCDWSIQVYRVSKFAGPLASDADACRNVGLEPYEGRR